jgi:hypothetical protein
MYNWLYVSEWNVQPTYVMKLQLNYKSLISLNLSCQYLKTHAIIHLLSSPSVNMQIMRLQFLINLRLVSKSLVNDEQ